MRRHYPNDIAKEIERPVPKSQTEYDAMKVQFSEESVKDGVVVNKRMDKTEDCEVFFPCC